MAAPPPYSPDKGYPGAYQPQPGGYPPQQAGYPQAGYPPTQPGYNQGYAPQPMMGQQSSNVVVVSGQCPQQTVVVQRQGVNHVLHFVISLFFWPWIIVWIILCITEGA